MLAGRRVLSDFFLVFAMSETLTLSAAAPVRWLSSARLPTRHGAFTAHAFAADGVEHLALTVGVLDPARPALVRLHSECLTGDVLGSRRCDCGEQLDQALQRIQAEGVGVLLYLRGHEGRGIGLGHKLSAYRLQEQGLDTVEANLALGLPVDSRDYRAAAAMLQALGVRQVRLLSNNPRKLAALDAAGLEVVERVALATEAQADNRRYLDAKRTRLGHWLP